jgi:hypothetical protein
MVEKNKNRKYQIPSTKSQINPNHPNSKQILFDRLKLEFGHYLKFGLPARSRFGEGRDFEIGIL